MRQVSLEKNLPLGYSATDIYLDPSGGDAQKTFQSTRLYATLPGHSGLMLFRSGDWVLKMHWICLICKWTKTVMWNLLRFWWRFGLCEVWVCSSSMLGLDCFSAVNSSRLFWWIMLGTQIYHWFINIHVAGGVYRSHSSVRTLGTIAVVVFKNSYHASSCVWISCTAYLYNS